MLPADLNEVLGLWRRVEGVGLNESDTPPQLQAYLRCNPGLSRVARIDDAAPDPSSPGELVGAVLCGHDGRRGYLHHLAVAPAWRRRGIARSLVDQCLAALADQGITRCNLFVFADNDDGQAFWHALGWRRRGELCMLQRPTSGDAGAAAAPASNC
jgi:putative acetyltransferase